MTDTADRTDPALWDRVKDEITAGDKGGHAGEWSARKAQMAVAAYKKAGGGYRGKRDAHNSLHEWSEEEWGTKSGRPSGETGERYLPKQARETLSDDEYRRTTDKKRADSRKGQQHSAQPADVADKTRPFRDHRTKQQLYEAAKKHNVPGRSRMNKEQLADALAHR